MGISPSLFLQATAAGADRSAGVTGEVGERLVPQQVSPNFCRLDYVCGGWKLLTPVLATVSINIVAVIVRSPLLHVHPPVARRIFCLGAQDKAAIGLHD